MQFLAGTSGFSYDEWKGVFYPEDLPADARLAYYAEQLPAVEINNTFYRMPKRSVLEKWREAVPPGFRFSIKASRRITHQKKLQDIAEPMGYLARNLETLGDRLGVVLFQLPPYLRYEPERLTEWLRELPEDLPACLEVRHGSWLCDGVFERLAGRNVALVVNDDEEAEAEIRTTADFGYLRLRRSCYDDSDLDAWVSRCAAQGWSRALVFFKHEEEGAGPKLAQRFLERADAA
ncbi:MAG: DUF72 domain-containing protein [Xanthomonadales bacterium]|nr:DUF72 domain-containing protein [Xanthomonadales bacterium]